MTVSERDPDKILSKIAKQHYKDAQKKKRARKGLPDEPKKRRRGKIIHPTKDIVPASNISDDEFKRVYDEIIIDRELGLRSLRDFAKICWPRIFPGDPYIEDAWHSDCLADHFEALFKGDIKKLLVSVPPGFGKSSWACTFLPVWAWLHAPWFKMAFGAYSYDNVKTEAQKCIGLMKSQWFKDRWGDRFELVKTDLRNVRTSMGGVRMGVSVGGQVLGIRANLVVADDPLNINEANSEVARAGVQHWWRSGMRTRGDMDLRELAIMQRLHDYDLIGYLLAEGLGDYEELILPAEYDSKRKCVTYTTDGTKFWEDPRTKEGELLFPQKFPKEFLDERRGTTDREKNEFSAMFQQDPVQAGGNIIKTKWFRYYPEPPEERYKNCSRAILSCDLAVKDKETSSYTVIQIWGVKGPNIYLIDQTRLRLAFTGKVKAIQQILAKWNNLAGPGVSAKLIEDKASGPDVMDILKDKIPGMIPFDGNDDKEERMEAITWLWEGGNVYVPGKPTGDTSGKIDFSYTPWMVDFFDEITRFPKSKFNDQAVTMSQAMVYIGKSLRNVVGYPISVPGIGNIAKLREMQTSRRQLF